mmetsp:Transcript_20438/g.48715  ORF Transcript_20438/g.48715 Transcript_20438/m.48715 type:complete len:440 (+) Transcript_20438:476-1795(+)
MRSSAPSRPNRAWASAMSSTPSGVLPAATRPPTRSVRLRGVSAPGMGRRSVSVVAPAGRRARAAAFRCTVEAASNASGPPSTWGTSSGASGRAPAAEASSASGSRPIRRSDTARPSGLDWPGHSAWASITGLAAATSGRFSSAARSASLREPPRSRTTRSGWPSMLQAARANSASAAPLSRCTPKASATPSITATMASSTRPGWSRQAGQLRWRHSLIAQRPRGGAAGVPGRCAQAACKPPPSRRSRRSAAWAATSECVTSRQAAPASCVQRRSRASTSAAWRASRLPVGSSASTRRGRCTSARAIATRCNCPPDSWRGIRAASPPRSTASSMAGTRLSSRSPSSRSGRATLSATLRWGSRWKAWKTKPRWRRRSAARASSSSGPRACPASVMWPASGSSSPARQFSSVDLPLPDSPNSATISPAARSRSMREKTGVSP